MLGRSLKSIAFRYCNQPSGSSSDGDRGGMYKPGDDDSDADVAPRPPSVRSLPERAATRGKLNRKVRMQVSSLWQGTLSVLLLIVQTNDNDPYDLIVYRIKPTTHHHQFDTVPF